MAINSKSVINSSIPSRTKNLFLSFFFQNLGFFANSGEILSKSDRRARNFLTSQKPSFLIPSIIKICFHTKNQPNSSKRSRVRSIWLVGLVGMKSIESLPPKVSLVFNQKCQLSKLWHFIFSL